MTYDYDNNMEVNATEEKIMELRSPLELGNDKFSKNDDGTVTVHDVRLLAAGRIVDSLSRTPTHITPEALQKATWKRDGFWSRHPGGKPRDITDKVGYITNQHYEGDCVIGDIVINNRTTKSKDVLAMMEAGDFNWVSAEIIAKESYSEALKGYSTDSIDFIGVAAVERGACESCTIRHNEEAQIGDEPMELEELKKEYDAKLDGIAKEFENVKKELEALKAKDAELEAKDNKDLEARIKALEEAPAAPESKEIEAGEPEKVLNLSDGVINNKGTFYRRNL
jgi:hypothetical protein